MSKLEADDHVVLKDDPDDENGASIQKINRDLETQRMLWGFPAKTPPQLHMCPCKQSSDGCRITVYG